MMDAGALSWLASAVLAAGALAVIGFNWSTLWRERRGWRHVPSPIPFFGGLLALLAMLMAPMPSIRVWCWVPLLIDWGSIPAIVFRQR